MNCLYRTFEFFEYVVCCVLTPSPAFLLPESIERKRIREHGEMPLGMRISSCASSLGTCDAKKERVTGAFPPPRASVVSDFSLLVGNDVAELVRFTFLLFSQCVMGTSSPG